MLTVRIPLNSAMAAAMAMTAFGAAAHAQDSTLTFANFRDVRDLNPHLYAGEMFAQAILYDGLVVLDDDSNPMPALAESWEVSEDGTVYTFHLRENVTFTDGHAFDAAVAKQNLDAVLAHTERHSWLRSMQLMLAYQEGGEDAVQVIDEHTLQINLTESYYPFIIELGVTRPYRMLSPNCFIDGETMNGVDCYVGTGSYILDTNLVDQEAVFVRNEDHWAGAPGIESIVARVIPDPQARLLALQNGEVDMVYGHDMIPPRSFAEFEARTGFGTAVSPPVATRMLILNSSAEALADVRLRQALNYLTNRDLISERIMLGLEPPAGTLLSTTTPYADIGLEPFSYDPDLAASLLTDAGYTLEDGAWVKDGEPIELTLTFNSDKVVERTIAQFLQSEWAEAGITLEVTAVESQAQRDSLRTGDFELAFNISWGVPYDPQSFLGSMVRPVYGDFHAQQGLDNKGDIDASIVGALAAVDEGERQEFYAYVLESLHDGAIYVPLTFESNRAVFSDRVGSVVFAANQFEIPFERMSIE